MLHAARPNLRTNIAWRHVERQQRPSPSSNRLNAPRERREIVRDRHERALRDFSDRFAIHQQLHGQFGAILNVQCWLEVDAIKICATSNQA